MIDTHIHPPCIPSQIIYSSNLKSGLLTTSASQQILGLRARLVLAQWSLALDTKICADSLFKFQTSSCLSIFRPCSPFRSVFGRLRAAHLLRFSPYLWRLGHGFVENRSIRGLSLGRNSACKGEQGPYSSLSSTLQLE
jgi:hypothetical protein